MQCGYGMTICFRTVSYTHLDWYERVINKKKGAKKMSMVKGVKGRQVYLRDEELLRRREENKNYLLELGSEHLLLPYLCLLYTSQDCTG